MLLLPRKSFKFAIVWPVFDAVAMFGEALRKLFPLYIQNYLLLLIINNFFFCWLNAASQNTTNSF